MLLKPCSSIGRPWGDSANGPHRKSGIFRGHALRKICRTEEFRMGSMGTQVRTRTVVQVGRNAVLNYGSGRGNRKEGTDVKIFG